MKRKHFHKVSLVVLTLVIACAVSLSCAPEPEPVAPAPEPVAPAPVEKEPMKIGFMSPLTGPAIDIGKRMKLAYELAVKEINEAGGILGGRMVEPIYGDEGTSGDEASTTAKKLITADKVEAIVMGYWSHTALATRELCKKYNLPLVVVASSSPEITDEGYYGMARIAATQPAFDRPSWRWAEQVKGCKTAYFLLGECDWAHSAKASGENYFAQPGTAELLETVFFPMDKPDMSVEVARIMALNPDFIFDYVPMDLQIQFCRLLKEADYKGPVIYCEDNLVEEIIEVGGEAVEGLYGDMSFVPNFDVPENKKFCESFYEVNGLYPWGLENQAYEASMLMMKAIDQAGTDSDLKAIGDAMHSIDWVTPAGYPMKLDANGQFRSREVYIVQVVNGKIVLVDPAPILPEDWEAR